MSTKETQLSRTVRVVVVYRVCPHWRAPMFARLNALPDIDLTVFHGQSIPGTKLVNATRYDGFGHQELFTLSGRVKSSGRAVPWVFCPFIGWHLIRHKPDVLVLEGGSNVLTNIAVYAYAKLWRKPIVWWTLGQLPGRKYSGLGRVYRWVVVRMERAADALLGYSSVALAYFQRMGYPRQKHFRAVNCVDTERVMTELEQRSTRVAELGAQLALTDRRVVLFVGALTAPKHIDRLIHAFARAREQLRPAHLLIVGDGPERRRLEALAADLQIAQTVTFAGEIIDGVSDYYELGDVFVLPGLGGLAVSEALTHGLPVICSQGDGCELDLVRNGVTGYRIDSSDTEKVIDFIAEKLVAILSDEDRRPAMSAAARKVILEEHNVGSYIENVAAAIRFAFTKVRTTPPLESVRDETAT